MNSLQSSLYTVAIALCLFSTGILSGRKSRTGRPLAYFTCFLIIETLGFVLELLMAHPATPLKALWLGLRMGTGLLVAPCLWLAIKESSEGVRPRLAALGRTQLGLIATGLALTLPLIASTHMGTDYFDPHHVVSPLHSRAIHGTMLLCIAVFAWQIPFYLWQCRRLLLERLTAGHLVPAQNGFQPRAWLHLPLAILFTTWVLGLLRTVQCASHAPQEFTVLFAFADVGVTVGTIYIMIRRSTLPEPVLPAALENNVAQFHAQPSVLPAPIAQAPAAAVPPETATAAKYGKSPLPAPIRERIARKIETAMLTEEVYCDSLLNLRSLSSRLKENAHYVSQVINQDLNLSFYQLVSRHRIERAKQLLMQRPDQTVLEIALSVGFNSKSTFNAAFRSNTGTTPRDYRSSRGLESAD